MNCEQGKTWVKFKLLQQDINMFLSLFMTAMGHIK